MLEDSLLQGFPPQRVGALRETLEMLQTEGIVKLLLERGDINPDSADDDGRTPLSFAAEYGHEAAVKLLLERGDVDPNSMDEYKADHGKTLVTTYARIGGRPVGIVASQHLQVRTKKEGIQI